MELSVIGLNFLYAIGGVILMFLSYRVIDRLTPQVDFPAELQKGNVAVAIFVAAIFDHTVLAECIRVEAAALEEARGEAKRHGGVVRPCAGGQSEVPAGQHFGDVVEGSAVPELYRRAECVADGKAYQGSPDAFRNGSVN